MELRKLIRTYNSPGCLGSYKECEPWIVNPGHSSQPDLVGNDHGYHDPALFHFLLKGCPIHSFSFQDISFKADKGQAKGGKAQQKSNNRGGKVSSQ